MTANFKSLFKFGKLFSDKSPKDFLGAVVYRTLLGKLEILLWQDKSQRWRLPSGLLVGDTTSDAAVISQIPVLYTLNNARQGSVKVLQSLGRISYAEAKTMVNVHLFLVQSLGKSAMPAADAEAKDFKWFTAEAATDQIEEPALKNSLSLAVSKIKRAQI